jgi:probable rRNA maturation factor
VVVLVTDDQAEHDDSFPVDDVRWASLATAVLRDLQCAGPAELNVVFVDEGSMADLNERFMGDARSTDVLAFPLDPSTGIADSWVEPDDAPRLLGDVVICPAVAARNAVDHAGTYDDEIALLLVHGILHVVGMDHDTDEARTAMQRREQVALREHHGELARDPWR